MSPAAVRTRPRPAEASGVVSCMPAASCTISVDIVRYTLYDLLLSKIKDEYKGFSKEAIRIQENNSFYKLDVKNKKEFIAEMIKLVQPDSNYPYLGKYATGLSDRMGRKAGEKVGKKITLVDKSVTGLYERRTTFELEDDSSTKSR